MRALTKKQKTLIENQVAKNGMKNFNIFIHDALEPINDYETLWQDATRYGEDYFYNVVELPF